MPFNPNDHLIKLQGKDYLEVKWRLMWLRELHPDAIITTELLAYSVEQEWALTRATVTLPTGGSATGTALQRPTSIAKDFFANGETSAIGRALGALGFGTQFAPEFDQGEQVVDSPVARPTPREEPNPELEVAKASLVAAMQSEKWSLARVIETAGFVWPHIQTKEDLGTLTAVQLSRLAEVVTGESVINLDVHGVKRIMPAPMAIGMA